jgi:hypothetical protein
MCYVLCYSLDGRYDPILRVKRATRDITQFITSFPHGHALPEVSCTHWRISMTNLPGFCNATCFDGVVKVR